MHLHRFLLGFAVVFALSSTFQIEAFAESGRAEDIAAAALHHDRGVQLFEAGDFNAAITEFQRAQELSPSRTNLWNLARCHEQIGRTYDALAQLERYLNDPELPADRRQRAVQYRTELQAALGASESSSTEEPTAEPANPPEEPVVAPEPTPEPPTEGSGAAEQSSRESGDGPSLAGPWIVLGAGLALALTGGILDIVAFTRAQDADLTSQSAYDEWRDGTRSTALAGDVLLGVGAAAAVGGLIWLLLARRSRNASTARRLSVTPVASNGFGLIGNVSF